MGNYNCCAAPVLLGQTNDPCFKWKIHDFSALLRRGAMPTTNSAPFFYSAYKWFLQLTPSHETDLYSGNPYVALSLGITRGTLGVEPGCVMAVEFELSIYNHSDHVYCGCKATFEFHIHNIYSEKNCLIRLKELLKSPDFLADDCCVFGVDILKIDVLLLEKKAIAVQKKAAVVQDLFIQKNRFMKWTYSVTINNFFELHMENFVCPAFELDGQNWYLSVYPRGNLYSNDCLSLFLHLDASDELPYEYGKLVGMALSIVDQKHGEHFTRKYPGLVVFAGKCHWGWSDFIPLGTLMDPSRGYLVGSRCTIKADITIN